MDFVIVETTKGARPILGLKSVEMLGLINRATINEIRMQTKEEILTKFKVVFSGIGKIVSEPINLKLKSNYEASVVPCRKVPFQLMESSLEERVSLENKEVSEENECNERTENEVVGEFVKKNELLSQRGLCDDSKIQEDYSLQRTDDNYCPRTKFVDQ
ncbi:hypothetical protein JTB14_028342 [Gonioctena quinquepunctata]|nr:hypothetical protein JTB14_028342 [Gonioctena quinquepunctata]